MFKCGYFFTGPTGTQVNTAISSFIIGSREVTRRHWYTTVHAAAACERTRACSAWFGHIQRPRGGAVSGGSMQSRWKSSGQKSHCSSGATRQLLQRPISWAKGLAWCSTPPTEHQSILENNHGRIILLLFVLVCITLVRKSKSTIWHNYTRMPTSP